MKILLRRWKWKQFSLCKLSLQSVFLSHPGSLCIFMYEYRWENGADECCFCSMGGGNTWNGSSVSTKSSSCPHLSAALQRAIQLLTVTLGQLKAIGIERCLCVHVWAHVCFLVISSDEPQEALQVSQCFTPSSPSLSHVHHFCSSFISPSSQSVCRDSHARWLWFRLPSAFSASHFPDLL